MASMETQDMKFPATALVLSGGGAAGAYEIGVMNALLAGKSPATNYEPLTVDLYCGTSIGAVNSSLMVARWRLPETAAIAEVEDIWRRRLADNREYCGNGFFRVRGVPPDRDCECYPFALFRNSISDHLAALSYFGVRAPVFVHGREPLEARVLHFFDSPHHIDIAPLYKTLRETVNLDELGRSPKDLIVAVTNWRDASLRLFGKREIAGSTGYRAIAASTAIPVTCPPVFIDGMPYVDGGVALNTPLEPAIQSRVESIHVVYLAPLVGNLEEIELSCTVETIYRVLSIFLQRQIHNGIVTVMRINAALDLLTQQRNRGEAQKELEALLGRPLGPFIRRNGSVRKLSVHRYFPPESMTAKEGVLGWGDFSLKHVDRLIWIGEDSAVHHNCVSAGCILPEQ
jgi:predicted acylesterase/phospholipase RssA